MNNNGNSRNGGIGFFGLLTIAFIVLKLCSVIDWSWIMVLSPLWIPIALAVIYVIVATIVERSKKK